MRKSPEYHHYSLQELEGILLFLFHQIEYFNGTTEREPRTVSYVLKHYTEEYVKVKKEIARR